MKKDAELGSGWTDVTVPIIGDEWQFIYKPQTDENADSPPNEQPELMNTKLKRPRTKSKEVNSEKNITDKKAEKPIKLKT